MYIIYTCIDVIPIYYRLMDNATKIPGTPETVVHYTLCDRHTLVCYVLYQRYVKDIHVGQFSHKPINRKDSR